MLSPINPNSSDQSPLSIPFISHSSTLDSNEVSLSTTIFATANIIKLPSWISFSWTQIVVMFILVWPIIVAGLRYRREQQRKKRFNFPTRESFAKMTVVDAWAIQLNLLDTEASAIFMLALKFAIFSVNGIPTISKLLVKTNKLPSERVHHRFSMTAVLIAEFLAFSPESERAKEAISRMNNIHQTYQRAGQILNEDLLYTLGLFAYLPVKWLAKYDWRELNEMEQCALGTFWKNIGDCMEIDYSELPSSKTGWKDGLHWLEEVTQWIDRYEQKAMVPSESNRRVALVALDIILWTIPNFLKPLARNFALSLLEDRMVKALMLTKPHKIYNVIISALIDVRRYTVRYLFPPRLSYWRFVPLSPEPDDNGRYYLNTYDSKPFYIKPTLASRWFSPAAISRRINGLPLPGDAGSEYSPNGYRLEELGPAWILKKKSTEKDVQLFRERLNKTHTTGCPFG